MTVVEWAQAVTDDWDGMYPGQARAAAKWIVEAERRVRQADRLAEAATQAAFDSDVGTVFTALLQIHVELRPLLPDKIQVETDGS